MKGPRRKQLQEESDTKDSEPGEASSASSYWGCWMLTQTTRPVMAVESVWTGDWGLTTPPCPWTKTPGLPHSWQGGNTAGSPMEGTSCSGVCVFFFCTFLLFPRHLLKFCLSLLIQSRTAHTLLELADRWNQTNRSPDDLRFIFTILQFLRRKLSNFYLPFFFFCDFTVFLSISDIGCYRFSYLNCFLFY